LEPKFGPHQQINYHHKFLTYRKILKSIGFLDAKRMKADLVVNMIVKRTVDILFVALLAWLY
jgi:hypothetical protein